MDGQTQRQLTLLRHVERGGGGLKVGIEFQWEVTPRSVFIFWPNYRKITRLIIVAKGKHFLTMIWKSNRVGIR